jgi:hypothetical protein
MPAADVMITARLAADLHGFRFGPEHSVSHSDHGTLYCHSFFCVCTRNGPLMG